MGNSHMGNASNQLNYWAQAQPLGSLGMQGLSAANVAMLQKLMSGVAENKASTSGIDVAKLELLKKVEPRSIGRRVPDGIIPITAWRVWSVANMKLAAIGSSGIWEPKKRMEAICNGGGQHPAPQRDCNCGMWAFKTLDGLVSATKAYHVKVVGQVLLWGRIIETENGFRAQYAYPKELWLLDESLEELGYIYGVPVRTA